MSSRDPYFVLITRGFNEISKNCSADNATTSELAEIDSLKTMCGSKQLKRGPGTHFGNIFQLYRHNFYQPTNYCYGLWNTFNSPFKVPSTNNLFKTQL